MKTRVYVVAGNTHEFFRIAQSDFKPIAISHGKRAFETEDKIYLCVSNPVSLRGVRGEVQFWGTANQRPDFTEFQELARVAMLGTDSEGSRKG